MKLEFHVQSSVISDQKAVASQRDHFLHQSGAPTPDLVKRIMSATSTSTQRLTMATPNACIDLSYQIPR
jgi:hypothetical protein